MVRFRGVSRPVTAIMGGWKGITSPPSLRAATAAERGKSMEISYSRVGDYLLPNIVLNEPPRELTEPITKYGAIRRAFLREHRPITYTRLVLSEQLFPHLREVQQEAHEQLGRFMSDMLVFRPPPDKTADSLARAAHMNAIKESAERMVLDEIVYI